MKTVAVDQEDFGIHAEVYIRSSGGSKSLVKQLLRYVIL
jgi:hypothetical protein